MILRPRTENVVTLQDRHGYRLVLDLFEYKEEIFSILKKLSTMGRVRAVSTDESNRKTNVEERNRAVVRARATSPLPGHRSSSSASYTPLPLVLKPSRMRKTSSCHSVGDISSKSPSPPVINVKQVDQIPRSSSLPKSSSSSIALANMADTTSSYLLSEANSSFATSPSESHASPADHPSYTNGQSDAKFAAAKPVEMENFEKPTIHKRSSTRYSGYGQPARRLVGDSDGDENSSVEGDVNNASKRLEGVQLEDGPMDDD